jgi:hypothetical protein
VAADDDRVAGRLVGRRRAGSGCGYWAGLRLLFGRNTELTEVGKRSRRRSDRTFGRLEANAGSIPLAQDRSRSSGGRSASAWAILEPPHGSSCRTQRFAEVVAAEVRRGRLGHHGRSWPMNRSWGLPLRPPNVGVTAPILWGSRLRLRSGSPIPRPNRHDRPPLPRRGSRRKSAAGSRPPARPRR